MKLRPTLQSKALQETTARTFNGGLDIVDSEYNLSSKFARVMKNVVCNPNGDLEVRFGTRLFGQLPSMTNIVGIHYFFRYIVAVDSTGLVQALDANGNIIDVWNTTIAATKGTTPWGATDFVSFTQFQGELIIANGTDKPLLVTKALVCNYLQDLPTASNVNTPVAKYACTHLNYLVMGGDPDFPGRLYISNKGTSGTWPGDLAPNDAITFDVDKYTQDDIAEITGLATFRDKLVVMFTNSCVTMTLGGYDAGGVHVPVVNDQINKFGTLAHRSIVSTGDNLYFMDYNGVNNIRQTLLTAQITPERLSTTIEPLYQQALSSLSVDDLLKHAFIVHDKLANRLLCFIPNRDTTSASSEATVLVASLNAGSAKNPAWHQFTQWPFKCGCVSVEGRVFFAYGQFVVRYGNHREPVVVDFEGLATLPPSADPTPVYVGDVYVPAVITGAGIPFDYEMPYSDFKSRAEWKTLHYIQMDTEGASSFTLSMYVDGLRNRSTVIGEAFEDGTRFTDGTGFTPPEVLLPYSEMAFIGGSRGEHGVTFTEPSPYRPTFDARLYAMFARFRMLKLRMSGLSYSHLRIVGVTLYYTKGSIY